MLKYEIPREYLHWNIEKHLDRIYWNPCKWQDLLNFLQGEADGLFMAMAEGTPSLPGGTLSPYLAGKVHPWPGVAPVWDMNARGILPTVQQVLPLLSYPHPAWRVLYPPYLAGKVSHPWPGYPHLGLSTPCLGLGYPHLGLRDPLSGT